MEVFRERDRRRVLIGMKKKGEWKNELERICGSTWSKLLFSFISVKLLWSFGCIMTYSERDGVWDWMRYEVWWTCSSENGKLGNRGNPFTNMLREWRPHESKVNRWNISSLAQIPWWTWWAANATNEWKKCGSIKFIETICHSEGIGSVQEKFIGLENCMRMSRSFTLSR